MAAIAAYRAGDRRAPSIGIERHDAIAEEIGARGRAAAAAAAGAEAAALSEARDRAARAARAPDPARAPRRSAWSSARFRVALRREPAGRGRARARAGGLAARARGARRAAEFLLSANPGEDLRPLAKVVSGGELSRTMLAVKTILAAADDVPTLVFDEVDAGIGGRVADVVGQKLRPDGGRAARCSASRTWRPIAAYAEHHLRRREARGARRHADLGDARSTTRGRVEEVARMLGGERVTDDVAPARARAPQGRPGRHGAVV